MLPPRDFKSLASAYSATPAYESATGILYITAADLSTDFCQSAVDYFVELRSHSFKACVGIILALILN